MKEVGEENSFESKLKTYLKNRMSGVCIAFGVHDIEGEARLKFRVSRVWVRGVERMFSKRMSNPGWTKH